MSVPSAYVGVILIWSTTPLAILWSSQEAGFIFGLTSRMVMGAILALMMTTLLGKTLVWHRRALHAYCAAALGIYGGMVSVYWAAQFIPTGWISVLFGLSPIITAIMAAFFLQGEKLNRASVLGMGMGVLGLCVMFSNSLNLSEDAMWGVLAMLVSVTLHCASAVWIQRIKVDLPAIVMTSGALTVAAPLFMLTWLLSGAVIPEDLSMRTWGSIAYLSLLGSVLGFTLYYYVLSQVDATKVALLTLMTPMCALALGNQLNGEVLTWQILAGSLLILSGLAVFEWGNKVRRMV